MLGVLVINLILSVFPWHKIRLSDKSNYSIFRPWRSSPILRLDRHLFMYGPIILPVLYSLVVYTILRTMPFFLFLYGSIGITLSYAGFWFIYFFLNKYFHMSRFHDSGY